MINRSGSRGAPRRPSNQAAAPPLSGPIDAFPAWRGGLGAAAVLGVLALFYADAFRMPFLSDDCVFLDHMRQVPFSQWWGFQELFFDYWRPWSREFHYGAMLALFGPSEIAFHVANFGFLAGCLAAFHALARHLTDARAAGLATVGLSAMAAWGLPALSISGVQDLWMILSSLLALSAWSSGRTALATVAFAVALASKETSCLLPGILLAHDLILERRPVGKALRRVALPALLTLAWITVHPRLGGRWLWHGRLEESPGTGWTSLLQLPVRALGSLVSLDRLPVPEAGWLHTLLVAILPALLLAAGAWLLAGGTSRPAGVNRPSGRRLAMFSLSWMLLGWLPLALPSLSWHAYYGLLGALGAWLLLGRWLSRKPLALGVGVAAVLVVLSLARGDTLTDDWADASYQREAGRLTRNMRRSLLGLRSGFPRGSRVHFAADPNNVGFLTRVLSEEGSSLRVWYRDSTLRAGFLGNYAIRGAETPDGQDFFFRLDPHALCLELPTADRDTTPDPRLPGWRIGHETLGEAFARAGDWRRAHAEISLLAHAFPSDLALAWGACVTARNSGNLTEARYWLREAERRPGDDPAIRLGLERARQEMLGREAGAR